MNNTLHGQPNCCCSVVILCEPWPLAGRCHHNAAIEALSNAPARGRCRLQRRVHLVPKMTLAPPCPPPPPAELLSNRTTITWMSFSPLTASLQLGGAMHTIHTYTYLVPTRTPTYCARHSHGRPHGVGAYIPSPLSSVRHTVHMLAMRYHHRTTSSSSISSRYCCTRYPAFHR